MFEIIEAPCVFFFFIKCVQILGWAGNELTIYGQVKGKRVLLMWMVYCIHRQVKKIYIYVCICERKKLLVNNLNERKRYIIFAYMKFYKINGNNNYRWFAQRVNSTLLECIHITYIHIYFDVKVLCVIYKQKRNKVVRIYC